MKTVTFFATSVAALAVIGGAAAGIASVAAPSELASVQLAAVGAPLPQDPPPALPPAAGANVPTPAQLTGLLNSLADPNVPFANKSNLVEGGISGTEAHMADHELKKAAKNGDLPLAFNVANIQPDRPGFRDRGRCRLGSQAARPVTQSVTFVNQGAWVLSRASAMQLLQAAGH